MANDNKTKRNNRQVSRLDNSFGKYSPEVVSRPVDTYVHHQAQDAGRNYQMLAASLSGIAPAINQFLKGKHDEQVATDEAKGQRFYYEQGEPLSWKDVREKQDARLKEIGVNTSVRNGYLKARMANEANIFREEMYNAYNSGEAKVTLPDGTEIPVAESDDPNVFNLWLNRFTSQYIKDNLGKDADPEYFAKIFIPQLEKNANEIQSIHIHERNRVLSERVISESNTRIFNAIAKLVTKEGTLSDSPDERKEVLAEIDAAIKDMRVSGLSHAQIDESLSSLILSMAMDPSAAFGEDFLYLARDIKMENGKSLWDTGTNALKFNRAIPEIQQRRDWREIREKRQRDERANLAAANLMEYVYSDKPIPPEVQKEFLAIYGQDALIKLLHNADTVKRYNFPDTSTAEGKARKKQADALINYVQTAIAKGEPVDLMQFVDTEAWNALTPSERDKIISLVNSPAEYKAVVKQATKYVEDIAVEFLEKEGHEAKSENYQRYFMALTGHLRSMITRAAQNPEVIANPEAFYQEVTREAYDFMEKVIKQPGILQAIKDKNLIPADLDSAVKVVAAEREEKIKKNLEQAQKANKPVDSLLYRYLISRASKKGNNNNPVMNMVEGAKVTGRFNDRRDYRNGQHNGIDLAPQGKNRKNTNIKSPDIGIPLTVTKVVTNNPSKGGGNQVVLSGKLSDDRPVEITISHLANDGINVKKGQTLNAGDIIGRVGNTGMTSEGKKITPWRKGKETGYHADIKIKVAGKYVDPEKFTWA